MDRRCTRQLGVCDRKWAYGAPRDANTGQRLHQCFIELVSRPQLGSVAKCLGFVGTNLGVQDSDASVGIMVGVCNGQLATLELGVL